MKRLTLRILRMSTHYNKLEGINGRQNKKRQKLRNLEIRKTFEKLAELN